jgi:hypothetical protein
MLEEFKKTLRAFELTVEARILAKMSDHSFNNEAANIDTLRNVLEQAYVDALVVPVEFCEAFDLERAKAGEPFEAFVWVSPAAQNWIKARYVGVMSNGSVVVEARHSDNAVIIDKTQYLRMMPAPTVHAYVNGYRANERTYYEAHTTEEAARKSSQGRDMLFVGYRVKVPLRGTNGQID